MSMRKIIKKIHFIIIPGLFLLLICCTPESCFEETEALVKVSFYDGQTGSLRAPDSLTIYGLNMESNKLYDKSLKVNSVKLPLNASTDKCVYIIKIDSIIDTLAFSYSSYPHLVSKECGYTFYHNIDTPEYTSNAIIYLYVNKSNITTINEENIHIFY